VLEHSVKPITFFFSFHKSRESFSLSFAEYNYILFRLNRWDANNKFARIAQTLWPTKINLRRANVTQKSFKEEDSFVAFELKTPPTVTVTLIAESASASLPIVTASWAPERKPRPLYESNNQNNFSLEEERRRRRGCQ
jgi:hypothetical protein